MKAASKFFKNVAKLKCFGMMVKNQKYIKGKMKSRLNSGKKIG
jgi:hypothetical protein